jgi:FkbM family methyltransferase
MIYYVRGGYYDYDAMTAMKLLLEPGQRFIDVGANIGSYATLAGRLVGPTGHVVAVEPLESQLHYLERNLTRLGIPFTICPVALADVSGPVSFEGHDATTHHLDKPGEGRRTIVTSTLDAEVAKLGFRSGDFGKIDVEGWESAVIMGARQWLREGPDGLLIEANGLNHRSPIPWTTAVNVLRENDLSFTWPSFERHELSIFEEPGPMAPAENYMVLSEDARRRLERKGSLVSISVRG